MATYTDAQLGSLDVSVLLWGDEVDFGIPDYEDEETENVYADVNTQLERRASKLRHLKMELRLQGTDEDDLIDKENGLRDELRKETNAFTVTPSGATTEVTFDLVRNPATRATFDRRYEKAHIAYYDVELVAMPWTRSATVTLWDAASETSPTIVEIGALLGHGEPPLGFTITRDWSGAGVGIETVVAALLPAGGSIADYLYEAEDGTLGDWVFDDTPPNYRGTGVARCSETSWTILTDVVDPEALPQGRYRILARARCSSGSGEDNCYIALGKQHDPATRDPRTRRLLVDHLVWEDLGEWTNYGAEGPSFWGKAIDGSLWIDCVLCVPVDYGWLRYDDPDEDTHLLNLGWLYAHSYTTTGATSTEIAAASRMVGHGLLAPLAGFSLLLLVEPHGSDPAPDFILDGSYDPRWEMWAPAPE